MEIILFRISAVTFEVSSCTKFQIFDPAEGAYSAPQPSSLWRVAHCPQCRPLHYASYAAA